MTELSWGKYFKELVESDLSDKEVIEQYLGYINMEEDRLSERIEKDRLEMENCIKEQEKEEGEFYKSKGIL